MHPCWASLPTNIVLHHVLPHCPIDVRLAFRTPPNKLQVPREAQAKLTAVLQWRTMVLTTPQCRGAVCVHLLMPTGQSIVIECSYDAWLNHRYARDTLFFKVFKRHTCGSYERIACVCITPLMSRPRPQCCLAAPWR